MPVRLVSKLLSVGPCPWVPRGPCRMAARPAAQPWGSLLQKTYHSAAAIAPRPAIRSHCEGDPPEAQTFNVTIARGGRHGAEVGARKCIHLANRGRLLKDEQSGREVDTVISEHGIVLQREPAGRSGRSWIPSVQGKWAFLENPA